ncbi:MAG: YbjN domain-containing protein [bacterium]
MKKSLPYILLASSLTLSSLPALAGDSAAITALKAACAEYNGAMVDRFSIQELKDIVVGEGYGSVKIKGDDRVIFKSSGRTFVLALYDDGDLQLYYGASGVQVTPKDINEWNRTKRLSRAYIDSEGDIALEADQFANGGLTREMVQDMIKVFVQTSVPQYVDFVSEHDQS